MNIGENIQNLRKKLGLSQEELAQKIPVSRQTVSQWENGQTVPSIDNLIILKEIFGVSVDEILGEKCTDAEKEKETANEPVPREKYTVRFSKEELKAIYHKEITDHFIRPSLFCLMLTVPTFLFYFLTDNENQLMTFGGFIFICGLILVLILGRFLAFRKSWLSSLLRLSQSTYVYQIFDDYLTFDIYRNGKKFFSREASLTDVELITDLGKWVSIQLGGQIFLMRKNELADDSFFLNYIYKKKSNFSHKPFSKKWETVSRFLLLISLISFFALSALIYNLTDFSIEDFWIYFLILPIAFASIVFGVLMKKKGYNYNKNIISGVIISILVIIFGSFSFVFEASSAPTETFRLITGTDLPAVSSSKTINRTDEKDILRGCVTYEYIITFDEDEANEFESYLATDSRWLASLPDEILGITAGLTEIYMQDIDFDYVLVFNSTEASFNKLPDESGIYSCFNALYNLESNTLRILEYHMDYVK